MSADMYIIIETGEVCECVGNRYIYISPCFEDLQFRMPDGSLEWFTEDEIIPISKFINANT